jgi:hypothetical protein
MPEQDRPVSPHSRHERSSFVKNLDAHRTLDVTSEHCRTNTGIDLFPACQPFPFWRHTEQIAESLALAGPNQTGELRPKILGF